jgi:hypothetical protein
MNEYEVDPLINWTSLLIGVVLGAIASWAITHVYYRRSASDLKSELDSLKRPLRLAEILDIVMSTDAAQDWNHVRPEAGQETIVLKTDVRISFKIDYLKDDVYREEWATNHPDPTTHAISCFLCFESVPLIEFVLVQVDGRRATLPRPVTWDSRVVSPVDYQVARIMEPRGRLDEYMERSGLTVAKSVTSSQ